MLIKHKRHVTVSYDVRCDEVDLEVLVSISRPLPGVYEHRIVSMTARQTERLIQALQRALAKFPRQKPRRKKA